MEYTEIKKLWEAIKDLDKIANNSATENKIDEICSYLTENGINKSEFN